VSTRSAVERSRSSNHKPVIQPIAIEQVASHEKTYPQAIVEPVKPEPAVIRVTIGRIEVRATTPPTPIPQQRAKQSAPRLSLDDYLRSRNGGKL
jgi:hypothetical protein